MGSRVSFGFFVILSYGCFLDLIFIFRFMMSSLEDKKPVVTSNVVLMMSKITEHKLNDLDYLDWSKTIQIYVRIISMTAHLKEDPPTDDSKEQWMEEDARLYL